MPSPTHPPSSPASPPSPSSPLPRRGLLASLAAIGPGIVVIGSVMGSGELINTPLQAATFGFVLLWAVLLSCVIKFFVQVEIARHCLVHDRTTIEALNQCPGPKLRGTSWIALVYMAGYVVTMITVVGIIGALGGLLHGLYPLAESAARSTQIWAVLVVLLAIGLLWQGLYRQLETVVALLVGGFSISIAVALVLIQRTPYRITGDELFSGLTFSLGDNRAAASYAVISLMGALGVAANELFMYPYWIREKGYATRLAEAGRDDWTARARQGINTIRLDAGVSTLLATVVTAAFFLLGAAVLYRQGLQPQGIQVVEQISSVYTSSFGQWSRALFFGGAFCTLFSTLIVVAAASSRMWGDLLGSLGVIDGDNPATLRRCHQVVQVLWLTGLLGTFFLTIEREPAQLVVFGHFVLGLFMTPMLMIAVCWLAFQTDRRVRMGRLTAVAVVASTAVIVACVAISLLAKYW